jgi:hypothetical protein
MLFAGSQEYKVEIMKKKMVRNQPWYISKKNEKIRYINFSLFYKIWYKTLL